MHASQLSLFLLLLAIDIVLPMRHIKCLVDGPGNSGRGSLISALVDGTRHPPVTMSERLYLLEGLVSYKLIYNDRETPLFMTKQLVFNEEPIELQLWKRTSTHQARFIPPFHTGTQYDHILLTCLPEIEHFSPKAPILLVGTKLDLLEDEEKIEALRARRRAPMDRKQGEALAADLGLVGYLECSAATDDGVDQVLEETVRIATC